MLNCNFVCYFAHFLYLAGVQRSTSITFKPAPSVASANALSVATLVASTADDDIDGTKQVGGNGAVSQNNPPEGVQIVPVPSSSADSLTSAPAVSVAFNTSLGE